jgi:hypothetical protein
MFLTGKISLGDNVDPALRPNLKTTRRECLQNFARFTGRFYCKIQNIHNFSEPTASNETTPEFCRSLHFPLLSIETISLPRPVVNAILSAEVASIQDP